MSATLLLTAQLRCAVACLPAYVRRWTRACAVGILTCSAQIQAVFNIVADSILTLLPIILTHSYYIMMFINKL